MVIHMFNTTTAPHSSYRPFRAGDPRVVPVAERGTVRSALRAFREDGARPAPSR